MADVQTMSSEKFCSISGYTDRQHRNIAKAGYFPPPYRGQYQTAKCLTGLIKYQREQLLKKHDTLRHEQELTAMIRRKEAQLDYDLKLEKYLLKADIGPALRNLGLHQRAVLVARLERELPARISGRTPVEVIELCKAAVDDICAVFSSGTEKWMEAEPDKTVETQPLVQ